MYSKDVLVTGSSGFIGTNLLKNNEEFNFYRFTRESLENNKILLNDKEFDLKKVQGKNFVFLHLATYFSKDEKNIKEINNGNLEFGIKVLTKLKECNLIKIIYTNTMFKFYNDHISRNLAYTKSKNHLSDFFQNYSNEKNISYEEIFFDNTYGLNDKRKKIIPHIVNSIKNKKANPIQNKDAIINLVHIEDIVTRLKIAINENTSDKSMFISNNSVKLVSIYDYLYSIFNEKTQKKLIYRKNIFNKNKLEIDHKGINLKSLEKGLDSLIK